jgi:hypothetical protein
MGAMKPELDQVAPTLCSITTALKATGVEDIAKLSTSSVGADMSTVMTVSDAFSDFQTIWSDPDGPLVRQRHPHFCQGNANPSRCSDYG